VPLRLHMASTILSAPLEMPPMKVQKFHWIATVDQKFQQLKN
jgi:hypothetical protein